MNSKRFRMIASRVAVLFCLIAVSTLSNASPYFITYTGTIENSDFPEVINGQSYTATLVFDNGASSAASQTWIEDDLTCAIFTMNDAQDARFANDMTQQTSLSVTGSASTDGSGVLSTNFTEVDATPVDEGTYTSVGIVLVPPINWYMNDNNRVFHSTGHSVAFGDPANGVQMAPANWTNPAPYLNDGCSLDAPVAVSYAPIPFAPLWVLILMTGLLMFMGVRHLRKS